MSDRIGVGIVGLSVKRGWAATTHVPALRLVPQFELRACTASTPESAAAAAEAHGVPGPCPDAEALVRRDDVDLVVITVKVPEHHRLVVAALDAGKHVLCEWPLGNGAAEADDLAARAAVTGVRSFVGLQARAAPAFRLVADLLRDGAIGEILSTTVTGCGDSWGPVVGSSVTYLLDRTNGATMLTIPVGHTLDAVCAVLGEPVSLDARTAVRHRTVRVLGTDDTLPMTAADQIVLGAELAGGAVLALHYRGGRTATPLLWEINGTDGDIVLRGDTGHLQYAQATVAVSDRPGGDLVERALPSRSCGADPTWIGANVAEAYVQLALDLTEGTATVPDFAHGARRHHTLAAIERAATSGTRQHLT